MIESPIGLIGTCTRNSPWVVHSPHMLITKTAEIGHRRRKSIVDGRNRPPTAEIDCRRLILAVSPGSGRSVYQSAVGLSDYVNSMKAAQDFSSKMSDSLKV
ncbi:hypothetical protein BHM03_00021860 [Ensete ventricosum]|nr:hypothetical protein BHM03_00021860 [Ensete ventricosum]